MRNSLTFLQAVLVAVVLAMTMQPAESAINLIKRDQVITGVPPKPLQGKAGDKIKEYQSKYGNTFVKQCTAYLSAINALTSTKTSIIKTTSTLSTSPTTVPVTFTQFYTAQTASYTVTPSVTSTVTSTSTDYSSTSTPATEVDTTITTTPTTTVTVTAVASPGNILDKRSVSYPPPDNNYPILQKLYNQFGQNVVHDGCLYVAYGYGRFPVPTSIISTTTTLTNSIPQSTVSQTQTKYVNAPGSATVTLSTVTVTETDTATVTTLSVAPTSTSYITSTVTDPTVTVTTTQTVPASQITGYFMSSSYAGPMYEYTDTSGTHITDWYDSDGYVYGSYYGQQATFVYDIASQGFQDCSSGTCNSNFMGAHDRKSWIYMGADPRTPSSDNPLLIQCSLDSVLHGPLNCNLQNGQASSYQFADCPNQHAQYFMTPDNINANGCTTVYDSFVQTGWS